MAMAQGGAYNAYLETGTHALASASPELFFDQVGGCVVTRPMKGTRSRGRWPAEDAARAAALVASGKDRAERVMIVDLLRNDLGRLARPGTVTVQVIWPPLSGTTRCGNSPRPSRRTCRRAWLSSMCLRRSSHPVR